MLLLELLTINVAAGDIFRFDMQIVNLIYYFLMAGRP